MNPWYFMNYLLIVDTISGQPVNCSQLLTRNYNLPYILLSACRQLNDFFYLSHLKTVCLVLWKIRMNSYSYYEKEVISNADMSGLLILRGESVSLRKTPYYKIFTVNHFCHCNSLVNPSFRFEKSSFLLFIQIRSVK